MHLWEINAKILNQVLLYMFFSMWFTRATDDYRIIDYNADYIFDLFVNL